MNFKVRSCGGVETLCQFFYWPSLRICPLSCTESWYQLRVSSAIWSVESKPIPNAIVSITTQHIPSTAVKLLSMYFSWQTLLHRLCTCPQDNTWKLAVHLKDSIAFPSANAWTGKQNDIHYTYVLQNMLIRGASFLFMISSSTIGANSSCKSSVFTSMA